MINLFEQTMNLLGMNIKTTVFGLLLYYFCVFILKTNTPKRMKIKELLLFSLPYLNIVLVINGLIGVWVNFYKVITVMSKPINQIKKMNKKTSKKQKKLKAKNSIY